MKPLLYILAIAAASAGSSVLAADFNLSGTVNSVCQAGSFTTPPPLVLVNSYGDLNPAGVNKSFTSATNFFCNGIGASVTVTHQDLTTPTPVNTASDQFTNVITFSAASDLPANGAFDKPATVTITGASTNGKKPVSWTYSGSVTITLTAG